MGRVLLEVDFDGIRRQYRGCIDEFTHGAEFLNGGALLEIALQGFCIILIGQHHLDDAVVTQDKQAGAVRPGGHRGRHFQCGEVGHHPPPDEMVERPHAIQAENT